MIAQIERRRQKMYADIDAVVQRKKGKRQKEIKGLRSEFNEVRKCFVGPLSEYAPLINFCLKPKNKLLALCCEDCFAIYFLFSFCQVLFRNCGRCSKKKVAEYRLAQYEIG